MEGFKKKNTVNLQLVEPADVDSTDAQGQLWVLPGQVQGELQTPYIDMWIWSS